MKTFAKVLLMFALGALPNVVYAEDIEIYLDPSPSLGGEPLVMFTLDYRSNLGSTFNLSSDDQDFFEEALGVRPAAAQTYFSVLRLALRVVFQELGGVKIGLLLPHDNINSCAGPNNVRAGCSNGGYIAMGFQSIFADDSNGQKARFLNILSNIPTPAGNRSHSWQGKEMWFEFFRYLTGQQVHNGRNGFTDYTGSDSDNINTEWPNISWDPSIMTFTHSATVGSGGNARTVNYFRYTSPLGVATACTRIFTINFAFGVNNQDSDSDANIGASRADGGLGINMSGNQGSFENMLRFLHDGDIGDGTFGAVPEIAGRQNIMGWLLTDQANPARSQISQAMGGGNALAVLNDPQLLVETLQSIFQQILSVSTTFVAASVPVNVFNRSEIVDNVYIALFQADPDRRPAWPGSLKKLKIEEDGNVVRLVDQLGNDAVAADGRINFNALTYWTVAADLPPADPSENELDGRDGRSVSRGGAGQRIPGFVGNDGPGLTNATLGARQLYTVPDTFTNGLPNTMLTLDATAARATTLRPFIGVATDAEAEAMLRWMRGRDEDNVNLTDPHQPQLARPWLLGDPLHSRPLPINYGARGDHDPDNPDIRIVIGSNDGYLRMIQNTNSAGVEIGQESWAFMPREVMDAMPTLRANTPLAAGTPPHPYTVDGAPVVYTNDINGDGNLVSGDGDRVIVYFGLRRGGRAYYAIDASNPDDPRLLWRINSTDTGFGELALSYATPQVGRVVIGSTATPVLVISGGYDPNKDQRLAAGGTNDSRGRAIYVVNALTGALIWRAQYGASTGSQSSSLYTHAGMLDSIPADATAVDTSGNGFIDRIYVGDTGGNVWRADLAGNDPTNWNVSLLAQLGRHYGANVTNDRRFFHAADVVLDRDEIGLYDAVIIGSGDRENPLDRGPSGLVTENFFYMIKDRRTASGPIPDGLAQPYYDHADFGDVTDNCLQSNSCDGGDPDLTSGWRLQLEEVAGEKSLAVPFTIAGTIFFTTYLPPGTLEAATCGPSEGGGILYAVALANATSVLNFDTTDDDPNNPGEATTRADRTRELRSGGIPAEVVSLPPNRILLPDLSTETIPGSMRWRTYWYEHERPDF